MKRCPACLSEIDDASATCAACAVPVAQSLVPAPRAPVRPTTRPREVLLGAALLVAAAIATFVLLTARGNHPSNLSAASPETASAKPSTPSGPAVMSAEQTWNGNNRAAWLGNGRGAAFELLSENKVKTWFGPTQPMLVVRCESRAIEVFVFTRTATRIEPNANGKTVTVSVDDEPARTERWSDSDDRVALFAPDGDAFARRLLTASTLRFGYSPHNADNVVAQFHVSGLGQLIEPVARECGWARPTGGGDRARASARGPRRPPTR